jgi:hypothetical protein
MHIAAATEHHAAAFFERILSLAFTRSRSSSSGVSFARKRATRALFNSRLRLSSGESFGVTVRGITNTVHHFFVMRHLLYFCSSTFLVSPLGQWSYLLQ